MKGEGWSNRTFMRSGKLHNNFGFVLRQCGNQDIECLKRRVRFNHRGSDNLNLLITFKHCHMKLEKQIQNSFGPVETVLKSIKEHPGQHANSFFGISMFRALECSSFFTTLIRSYEHYYFINLPYMNLIWFNPISLLNYHYSITNEYQYVQYPLISCIPVHCIIATV